MSDILFSKLYCKRDTGDSPRKHIFKSKLRRKRRRQRMHKGRTVFDDARRGEVSTKCQALANTVVAAPAPKCKPLPEIARLQELLIVDFETGVVTARVQRPRLKPGDVLGTETYEGYLQIYIDHVPYRLHRIIWKMFHGCDPSGQIDHIDGNRQNNPITNLRDVLPLQNSRNRCKESNNSSGRLGVSKCFTTGLWIADIGLNDRNVHLGKYSLLKDAIAARECGELHLYGMAPEHQEAV